MSSWQTVTVRRYFTRLLSCNHALSGQKAIANRTGWHPSRATGVLKTEDSFEPCPELTRATQSRERL
jgi:hypothetical protein